MRIIHTLCEWRCRTIGISGRFMVIYGHYGHGFDGEIISFQIIQINAIEFMTESGKIL